MSKKFIPREYQGLIINQHLELDRCATWAGMGLGKTVATLSSIELKLIGGIQTKPTLVLAPKRVAQSTWPDEAKKWDHLRNIEVQPLTGDFKTRIKALRNPNASVFTINYEQIPWLFETLDGEMPFGSIVADEVTKLKGFRLKRGSTRAKALGYVAHKVPQFIGLTGTPAPNGLVDLWGQMWFVDRGARLGKVYGSFLNRWFSSYRTDTFTKYTPLPFAQAQIEDALRDICLTIEAKDYFDLREPIASKVYVELPSKARQIYRAMEKELFAELNSGTNIEALSAAAKADKCHQLANGAAYVEGDTSAKQWVNVHDAKLDALSSIMNEANGNPVLVAYHYKSDLARIREHFPSARVLDDNPATITEWNLGKIPMLLAHPASAGHGLNLQDGGHILAYYSIDWNLENHQQILERIGPTRQLQAGYERAVFVYYILARDTVDEEIMARLEGKGSTQQLLIEAMKRRG